MSADNAIYVQQVRGFWYVWMGFVSSDDHKPSPDSQKWATYEEAHAYALGWLHGETIVEYGIIVLEAQEQNTTPPLTSIGWRGVEAEK